ncbi:MAG TPA: inositol monophosphatase family protein [Egibacteraceae bacterium]|nr:inositol monophosphatase family protein [Egibacteraceae bacterium]
MTRDLLALGTEVAVTAGRALLARQDDVGRVDYKTSSTDPVSEADRAAERLIAGALLDARPDDGLIGEEGADRKGSTGLRWVVDPIDGTVNYLYGLPAWCVSIACEDDEGAVVGVVYQPVTGTTYGGVRGEGSWCDGTALRVNDPVPLERALVATGFSYEVAQRTRQAAAVARLLPQVRDIRRLGSAALDLCMLAAGMVDAYYETTTKHWDWAAGALIAREAGARVTHDAGAVVAAGPALYPALHTALAGGT